MTPTAELDAADHHNRKAWAHLSEAREIRNRIESGGQVYHGEASRIPTLVTLARLSMQLSISYRRTRRPINANASPSTIAGIRIKAIS